MEPFLQPMVLPDPWIPSEPYRTVNNTLTLSSMGHGALVGTNNDAILTPFVLPCDMTIYQVKFFAGNGTGNYDLGLYNSSLVRLASTGSTAMSAAGVKTLSLSDTHLAGGDLIYAALALSSTAGTVLRQVANLSQLRGFGVGQQASAVPLPDPFVPVTPTGAILPLIAFGVR